MSYHGYGRYGLGGDISIAADSVAQPAGIIAPMQVVQFNPMLPSSDYESGDQAMIREMQSRTGVAPYEPFDTGAMQQPSLTSPIPSTVAPVAQPTTTTKTVTDAVLYGELLKFFMSLVAGQQPHHDLQEAVDYALKNGKHQLLAQAEMTAMKAASGLTSGVAPTMQPAGSITNTGAPAAPSPQQFVKNVNNYQAQVGPIVSLDPAQISPVVNAGAISPPLTPSPTVTTYPTGTIPAGTPSTGSIPQGLPNMGPIPPGMPPIAPITTPATQDNGLKPAAGPAPQAAPVIPTYSSTVPANYQQQAAAAATTQKSSIVPIVAIGAAALLLTKLL